MSYDSRILFWLAARNAKAWNSIENELNSDTVGPVPDLNTHKAFIVAFDRDVRVPGTLLTLGREGDVQLLEPGISRIQCQVQLNPQTQEILIRDTSTCKNTKVVNYAKPESLFFSRSEDVPRQVVIRHGDPIQISMGGHKKDLFQFEVIWPRRDPQMQGEIENRMRDFLARRRNRIMEVTHYATPLPALEYESTIQTSGSGDVWLHRKLGILGIGTFGDVHKTLNMHTGEYFAVKIMRRTESSSMNIEWRKSVLNEVRLLQRLSYRHVVEYYHAQGGQNDQYPVEIFMGLYSGSVEDLLEDKPNLREGQWFLMKVFQQMLKALTYIASIGIIHRDVKPANILYTMLDPAGSLGVAENFRFVLSDFGLSKEQVQARTLYKGSPLFMAPEMRIPGVSQTEKVDIYSLGVTILVLGDVNKLHSEPVETEAEIQPRLETALQNNDFGLIVPLLHPNPHERPSSKQLLVAHASDDEEVKQMIAREGGLL